MLLVSKEALLLPQKGIDQISPLSFEKAGLWLKNLKDHQGLKDSL